MRIPVFLQKINVFCTQGKYPVVVCLKVLFLYTNKTYNT